MELLAIRDGRVAAIGSDEDILRDAPSGAKRIDLERRRVIPGLNDSDEELTGIAEFLAGLDPAIPWHLSQYYPAYRMHEHPPTPVETLRRACGDERVANAAHDLGLRRLFALATLAHSCVSLDSGPAHVAAACGCPVVVLMGMADPRRNRPLGRAAVEIVTSVPEDEWPATRAEWEAWHQVAAIEVPAVVAALSFCATGASFTGVTTRATLALAVLNPSLTT